MQEGLGARHILFFALSKFATFQEPHRHEVNRLRILKLTRSANAKVCKSQ